MAHLGRLQLPMEIACLICSFLEPIRGRTSDQGEDDLRSLRLVDRTFAAAGANYLFEYWRCLVPFRACDGFSKLVASEHCARVKYLCLDIKLDYLTSDRPALSTASSAKKQAQQRMDQLRSMLEKLTNIQELEIVLLDPEPGVYHGLAEPKRLKLLIRHLEALTWPRLKHISVSTDMLPDRELRALANLFFSHTTTSFSLSCRGPHDRVPNGLTRQHAYPQFLPATAPSLEKLIIHAGPGSMFTSRQKRILEFGRDPRWQVFHLPIMGLAHHARLRELCLDSVTFDTNGLSSYISRCAQTLNKVRLVAIKRADEDTIETRLVAVLAQLPHLEHLTVVGLVEGLESSRIGNFFGFGSLKELNIRQTRLEGVTLLRILAGSKACLTQVHISRTKLFNDAGDDDDLWTSVLARLVLCESITRLSLGIFRTKVFDPSLFIEGAYNMLKQHRLAATASEATINPRIHGDLWLYIVDNKNPMTLSWLGEIARNILRRKNGSFQWLPVCFPEEMYVARRLTEVCPPDMIRSGDATIDEEYAWASNGLQIEPCNIDGLS